MDMSPGTPRWSRSGAPLANSRGSAPRVRQPTTRLPGGPAGQLGAGRFGFETYSEMGSAPAARGGHRDAGSRHDDQEKRSRGPATGTLGSGTGRLDRRVD